MAIAYVSSTNVADDSGTDTSHTLALSVNSGDCIVVIVAAGQAKGLGSISDNGSNLYTQQAYYNTAAPYIGIYATVATDSAITITCNWTSGSGHYINILKYSGVGSIGSNAGTQANTSSTVAAIPCTLAASINWAVAGLVYNSGGENPTAQNGSLRQQTTTGAYKLVGIDNTGATSLQCRVTYTTAELSHCAYLELVPPNPPSRKPSVAL